MGKGTGTVGGWVMEQRMTDAARDGILMRIGWVYLKLYWMEEDREGRKNI